MLSLLAKTCQLAEAFVHRKLLYCTEGRIYVVHTDYARFNEASLHCESRHKSTQHLCMPCKCIEWLRVMTQSEGSDLSLHGGQSPRLDMNAILRVTAEQICL